MTKAIKFKGLTFYNEYEHVLNHIRNTNPYPPGHHRCALTNAVDPAYYFWIPEPIDFYLDLVRYKDMVVPCSTKRYQNKIKKGSMPPAIIARVRTNGSESLLDGQHRIYSAVQEGITNIKVYKGIRHDDIEELIKSRLCEVIT